MPDLLVLRPASHVGSLAILGGRGAPPLPLPGGGADLFLLAISFREGHGAFGFDGTIGAWRGHVRYSLRHEALRQVERRRERRKRSSGGRWMWNQAMQLPGGGVSPVRGVGCHG